MEGGGEYSGEIDRPRFVSFWPGGRLRDLERELDHERRPCEPLLEPRLLLLLRVRSSGDVDMRLLFIATRDKLLLRLGLRDRLTERSDSEDRPRCLLLSERGSFLFLRRDLILRQKALDQP